MKHGTFFISIITAACAALMFAGCENIPELSPAAPPSAFTFTPVDGLREGVNALTGMKAGDFNMDGVTLDDGGDEAGRDNGIFAIDGRELFFAQDTDGGLYYVKFSAAGGGLTHATLIFVEPSAPAGIGYTAERRLMTGTAAFRGDIPVGAFRPQGGKPPYSYSVVDCPGDDEIDKDNASFRGGADGVYAKALTAGTTYKVYVRVTDGEGRHYQQGITVEAKEYAPPEFSTDDDFVRFDGGLVEGMIEYDSRVFFDGRNLQIPPFMLAKYEVSKKLWWDVYDWATKNGYTFVSQSGSGAGLPESAPVDAEANNPQTCITWNNAVVWLNALTEMRGLGADAAVYRRDNSPARNGSAVGTADWTRAGYRLPYEAEWEYAARGGKPSLEPGNHWLYKYAGTNDEAEYEKYAYYNLSGPTAVGLLRPNTAGLYDMSGNAAEWCGDTFKNPYGKINAENYTDTLTDVRGPNPGGGSTYRVIRGSTYKGKLSFLFWQDGMSHDSKVANSASTITEDIKPAGIRIARSVRADG